MNNLKIKCVVFDCDGTLIDSERLCCRALINIFSDYSDSVTEEDILAYFQGGKLADILSDICEKLDIRVSLDILEYQYRGQIQRLFETELIAMDGALDVVQALKKQGIAVCVVSNNPKRKIEFSLKITHLLDEFEGALFSAFDANSWKPEPDLLCYAAMNMGVLPQECIYIDDTPRGVEAGVQAHMQTLHLRMNPHSPRETKFSVPEVADIREVLAIVNEANVA